MPYEAVATSATPALIIYLIDVSASMTEECEGSTRIAVVNRALETVLRRMARLSLKGTQIAPRYHLAMITYSDSPMDILRGVLPINEVIPLGRPELETFENTNTYAAFEVAKRLLESEIPKRRGTGVYMHPAPLVCHLTDGEFNKGPDPERIAREIMGMQTEDGNVLVENIFVGSNLLKDKVASLQTWPGVRDSSDLDNDYAKKMLRMSSKLPESYALTIQRAGYGLQEGMHMLIPGGSADLIELAFAMSGATPVGEVSNSRRLRP